MTDPNVVVTQAIGEPAVPLQIIAQSIRKISETTQSMYRTGLTEKTMVMLISEASGVGRRDVQHVLNNMYHLANTYLVQPKKSK